MVLTILKNMSSSMGRSIPYMKLKIKNLWNHQAVTIIINISSTLPGDRSSNPALGREFTSVFSSSWVASFKVLDAPVPMATPRRHDARACGVSFSWVPQSWARHEARKPMIWGSNLSFLWRYHGKILVINEDPISIMLCFFRNHPPQKKKG